MKILPLLHLDHQAVAPLRCEESPSGMVLHYEGGIAAQGRATRHDCVVQWHWTLCNTSTQASPRITKFSPLSLQLPCRGSRAPILHGSGGGLDEANFPPASWAQWSKTIATEGLPHPGVTASSAGGRSANKDLPFFVVENFERSGGWFLGIGWSGDWNLAMRRAQETVWIEAGMTHLNLSLLPGESFSQPTILIGEYSGDAASGQRALRNYLRDHVQPKLDGHALRPLSFWDNYYGDRGNFVEADALAEMPLAAEAGLEYFVVDGGWSGGGLDGQFESLLPHIGSWRICREKFPGGWQPLRDAAAKHGIKLGVWCDIEHAHSDSEALQQHPELFFPTLDHFGCRILRLDTQAGLDWALQTLSGVLRESGAHWLRFDFNADPAATWQENDADNRRGETEIRYLENLYRLWDAMREEFPYLAIENCASGGRRIDLETIRRTHTDWLSDHSQSEAIMRFHLHGAARWLPANHLSTSMAHAFLEPNRPVDWTRELPAAAYLSHFGGNFSISDRLAPMTPAGRGALRRYLEVFHQTASCFAGEVFTIGRQDKSMTGPTGIAGLDSQTGKRAAVLFGITPQDASTLLPAEFQSLAARPPLIGDEGDEQFCAAYLWAD